MAGDWPLVIDGREFSPVPETWIEHGHDDGDGSPRLYAVSAAVCGRDVLHVRYAAACVPKVLVAHYRGERGDDGLLPACLAKKRTWPRSITPAGNGPDDVARSPEIAHLREVWSERVEAIPGDGAAAVADGGRAVDALGDLAQTHLGFKRSGGDQL